MSEPTNQSAMPARANKGVKQGLPTSGLKVAEESALKLWDVARRGTTAKEAFGQALGWRGASGGGWDSRIALMRGMKLIRFEGEEIGLTDLGIALVNGSDPSRQASSRRTAVMNLKAYRELVADFDGTPLPDPGVLASRLQFDFGKKEAFATKAAAAFIESLRRANMVDPKGNVRGEGEEGLASGPRFAEVPRDPGDDEAIDAAEEEQEEEQGGAADYDERRVDTRPMVDREQATERSEDDPEVEVSHEGQTVNEVSLSVNLDLSGFRADEVLAILRELGLSRRV